MGKKSVGVVSLLLRIYVDFKGRWRIDDVNWRAVYAERCTYGSGEGQWNLFMQIRRIAPIHDPQPSQEDIQVTKRLADSGKMIGIELLDHLIIGEYKFTSLKEKGYLWMQFRKDVIRVKKLILLSIYRITIYF